jgi:hypothetical protein
MNTTEQITPIVKHGAQTGFWISYNRALVFVRVDESAACLVSSRRWMISKERGVVERVTGKSGEMQMGRRLAAVILGAERARITFTNGNRLDCRGDNLSLMVGTHAGIYAQKRSGALVGYKVQRKVDATTTAWIYVSALKQPVDFAQCQAEDERKFLDRMTREELRQWWEIQCQEREGRRNVAKITETSRELVVSKAGARVVLDIARYESEMGYEGATLIVAEAVAARLNSMTAAEVRDWWMRTQAAQQRRKNWAGYIDIEADHLGSDYAELSEISHAFPQRRKRAA